ncbi:RsmB/NOP family class I SAM-dependent RNA methyltransferase [Criblamydia sequanensis]|uniref:Ribosomal RNA small subunit methyltransferase B n=1 Tax=Candidatus Criblamydia sequanensis CRIB-18 TaxID=1437425 RepID=A0A090CY09_9BACT|nr:RsmB/NOP family class I SAM-dependent RNA methyltransferase [Criblamydia sequanensis]CDR33041.1 putative ribosomal RNA small subunit methyltransferase B [Criblamydia sequanensis CRIB-18]
MINVPFRKYHLLSFLNALKETVPMDVQLRDYLKNNKAIGSKDRAYIADTAYTLMRWKGLLDYILGSENDWEGRLKLLEEKGIDALKFTKDLPDHVKFSFPKFLYEALSRSFETEELFPLLSVLNEKAPICIRANALKIDRDDLFDKWSDEYPIQKTEESPYGIVFEDRVNLFGLEEFKKGFFEVQDEASQLVGLKIEAKPGDCVLDFCSGSGGKTLCFAPFMENKGQIYLHDVRKHALKEAKKRLKRAGIQNAQLIENTETQKLSKLKRKMDWVLVDAPCTGTGTLRRNPDMKWKLTEETLKRLLGLQRTIFEQALSYLKPNGIIAYATCSLLKEENEDQVAHFLKTYPLELIEPPFATIPKRKEKDGLFVALFKKVEKIK